MTPAAPEVGPPALPEHGIWKVLFGRYLRVEWAARADRRILRWTGFSPITFLWLRNSGTDRRPALLLETIGRRSGQIRQAVLPYWEVGDDLVVLGTVGGAPKDPQWVGNLRADPHCWAYLRRRRVPLIARVASDDERVRLGEMGVWHTWLPNYQYNARSHGREVPFVVLTPRTSTTR